MNSIIFNPQPYNAETVNEAKELSAEWIYITIDRATGRRLDSVRMINETEHTYLIKSLDSTAKKRMYKKDFFKTYKVIETIRPRQSQADPEDLQRLKDKFNK